MGKIFYKNTAAIICLLIAAICFNGTSHADMQEAELFEKAYEYYLAFSPEKALESFDLFLQQYPDSSALDSVFFWRAKSLVQLKRVEEAVRGFQKLKEVFPQSSYALFAEKELESLKALMLKTDKADLFKEKTAKAADAKNSVYENRIKKLEAEKLELERQLSDAEKKRQLTEKGLSKALDDKNTLEAQIEEMRKLREDVAKREASLDRSAKEASKLAEEKRSLETRLKANEEKTGNLSSELARMSAEKTRTQEQAALEKKRADDLLAQLQARDETLRMFSADEEKRKSSDASLESRLSQSEAELKRLQTEREGLQVRIKNLESQDSERIAAHARDVKKLREETSQTAAELDKLQKENIRLLEEKRALDVRLSGSTEQVKALSAARDKETEKEHKALQVRAHDLENKLREAEARTRQLSDERQKLDLDMKEREQRLAKTLESLAVFEKRTKELERERESSTLTLNDRTARSAQEKAVLEEELKKEKKKVAELSVKSADQEATLLKETKSLEKVRQELDSRDKEKREMAEQIAAAKKSREEFANRISQAEKVENENKKLQDEKKGLEQKLREADERTAATSSRTDKDKDAEIKAFSEKLKETDRKLKDSEVALKKSQEERSAAEVRIQDLQSRLAKSQESIALLEKTIKVHEQEKEKKIQELNERIRIAENEKKSLSEELSRERKMAAEISGKGSSKETALLNEVKALEKARQDLELRLTAEKAQHGSDVKKFENERAELQAKLKTEKAELEVRLKELGERTKDLPAVKQQAERAGNEKKALETMISEKDSQLAKARETIALLQNSLKESEKEKTLSMQSAGEAGNIAAERDDLKKKLQTEAERMMTQKRQTEAEFAELKKANQQYAAKNAELVAEVTALKSQYPSYEKPFLRIGRERYSLAAVIRDGMLARNVTDKIQVTTVSWRTGNVIDDFIVEEILLRQAEEEKLAADTNAKGTLVQQYALNAGESTYLDKYLVIDALVKKRIAAPAIAEKDLREYYDKHRDQYLQGHENRIRVLSLKYGKTDELEKSILAVEMHEEALAGRPFDAIAKKRSAVVAMREMSLSRLPDWVRTKISGLREGEISNIISTESELMILQTIPSRPAYRSFEDVKKEIVKKLSAEQSRQKQSFDDWLNSLKKDFEFLR